jgi:hypothetical protein
MDSYFFSRFPLTWYQRLVLPLVRHKTLQLMQCAMPLLPRPGVVRDFTTLRELSRCRPIQPERDGNRGLRH